MEITLDNVSNALMNPQNIRRENLRRIVDEHYGGVLKNFVEINYPHLSGAQKENKQNYISQVWGGHKAFTEKFAKEIEKLLGYKEGYLSRPQMDTKDKIKNINDYEAMETAISQILNQFIQSRIISTKGDLDTQLFAALAVSKYREILDIRKDLNKEESGEKAS